MPVAAERKPMFARGDLVEKLKSIASRKGMSLYSLVNSIFESYIKLTERGIQLEVVEEALHLYKLLAYELVPVPRGVLAKALEGTCSSEALLLEARSAGARISKLYEPGTSGTLEMLKDLEKIFKWIGELSFNTTQSKLVRLTLVNTAMPQHCTRLVLELVKGALESRGFKQVEVREAGIFATAVFREEGGKP